MSRDELHDILMTLLQMENISEIEADELVILFLHTQKRASLLIMSFRISWCDRVEEITAEIAFEMKFLIILL